ncbi:MAG TPA: hypothetical protein VE961_15540 [Pyrinomonadaceae bacterium]|nr:hypothetical protein [Pyrinomonadaceae bacterium]
MSRTIDWSPRVAARHERATQTEKSQRGRLRSSLLLAFIAAVALTLTYTGSSGAQSPQRSGAHSRAARETFTPADRRLVERAIGATCAERIRDPQGSTPIDEMQARPSLPVNNTEALAGARRAERLLPATRKLVISAIVQLAKDYDLYESSISRARINSATVRVDSVKRVKADVDARDNASVALRDPRTIEFGTIFLAGLRSDEAMISVLAHELTHIASGQADSLRPLFRAIGRKAGTRTGLRIQGQRAEELSCDLVGALAAREFIKQTASWEPVPRRIARAFEHNCVDDDASDEDHLSPRNTIRALFTLDTSLANELAGPNSGSNATTPFAPIELTPLTTRF